MRQFDEPISSPCRQAGKQQKSKGSESVAKIIASFNTWAFKREHPSDLALLESSIRKRTEHKLPINFVMYWGKGPRTAVAQPELDCLDFLASMGERVRAIYQPGASFRLICTDTHARLNGHSKFALSSYFHSVAQAAGDRGFQWCMLDDVAKHHSSNISHICTAERPKATIDQLERSAERWYNGTGKPRDGAIAYYDMNMVEKLAVEREFPDAIFITFSGSDLRELFPERLPIFYMYSVRKGISVKPWFIEEEVSGRHATGPHTTVSSSANVT